jgi:hypothetical protein
VASIDTCNDGELERSRITHGYIIFPLSVTFLLLYLASSKLSFLELLVCMSKEEILGHRAI